MANLTLPVRWYSKRKLKHGDLELEIGTKPLSWLWIAIVAPGIRIVEDGIAPALAAARTVDMRVVFYSQRLSPSLMSRAVSSERFTGHAGATRSLKTRPSPASRIPYKTKTISPSIQPFAA